MDMFSVKAGEPLQTVLQKSAAPIRETRSAVRFPLSLPVVLSTGEQEFVAVTRNISSNGVLFEMSSPLKAGIGVGFSVCMPGAILGTPSDILVHCLGRVVRCSMSQNNYQAAATIEEYRFAEQWP